jgi:hypothetical protein
LRRKACAIKIIVVLLIACWLAVAAERYLKRRRAMSAKERGFIAESTSEAYAIKQQREALQQTVEVSVPASQPTGESGLTEVTMRGNDERI